VRIWALLLLAVGCGNDAKAPGPEAKLGSAAVPAAPADAPPAPPPPVAAETYPDLASALAATIPADARVVGFGELHMRTDRKQVTATLVRFRTDALPALQDKLSDLVVETWLIDPKCGQKAQTATAKVEVTMRRPQETKSDIALLAEAAAAAKVQPHAMKLACSDYDTFAPKDGNVDPAALLSLTTRELTRITSEAVVHRDKKAEKRPWIGVYGGALHNDRFPSAGVEDWSYASKIDEVTKGRYVEIDLIAPELAELEESSQKSPWFGLVTRADDKVHVYKRGERSFVVVLPKAK
jgi:hypothetical protein